MLSEKNFLALRLEGPLQAWGFDSQYNRRNTSLMPTKSAIAGICCAALGLTRGSDNESEFLSSFNETNLLAISIPRIGTKKDLAVRRLQDYHTVQNTRTAEGKKKDCHITHRQYLADAAFGVVIEGEALFLQRVTNALENPVWGLWLGRKTCIPTAPILAGLRGTRKEAIKLLIGEKSLDNFMRQEEAKNFTDGQDSIPDLAVSFATDRRLFTPRRIRTLQAGEKM